MLTSWRTVISCMEIWLIVNDGDMIRLDKFIHLYLLKESRQFRYYELVPWDKNFRLIIDFPSSLRHWKSRYFFVSGDRWETASGDLWGDVPKLLRRWETPKLGAISSVTNFSFFSYCNPLGSNFF